LYSIISNLVDNAIKYADKEPEITIRAVATEGKTQIRVQDNGPGIPEEYRRHIFDKFYQGDRSRATEGNGLGLALVKRIIELSEGSIEVENDMKKGGVCFRISLPYLIEDMM